jgi:hypothetical protein
LALAILVGLQSVLLNILSLFCAVSALSLLLGNMFFIVAVIFVERHHLGIKGVLQEYGDLIKAHVDLWSGRSNPLAFFVAPLLIILFCTALVYPPNNYDSMTYHMARVVYWMQNASVAYYPTSYDPQNLMSPGAEYIILLLQLLSDSDAFANLVQFISFYLLISAMPSFLRLLGIPRRIANWGLILAAALPMGVLQATSTQTDLVAACLGLALCAAALRLYHKTLREKKLRLDIMALGLMLATGFLVKPTSILAALPFLIMAAMCYGMGFIRQPQMWRRQIMHLLLGMLVAAAVAGPDLYRKKEATGSFTGARGEVYPFIGEWEQKVVNPVECILFHVIPTKEFYENIVKPFSGFMGCPPFPQPAELFRFHEDFAGNFLHIIFAGIAILLFLFRFQRIPHLARWGVLFVCLSWIFLHVTVRYTPFISRLETPVFMLFPCFLAAWAPVSKLRPVRSFLTSVLVVSAMACLSYGFVVAGRNEIRPLNLHAFWHLDRDLCYYANIAQLKPRHDAVIIAAQQMNARGVGLVIGNDYDYPLSWRLYRLGIEVWHVSKDNDLKKADIVYAPESRPAAIKEWSMYKGDYAILINPQFEKKALKNNAPLNPVTAGCGGCGQVACK